MTAVPYSALTQEQLAQVTYLFADETFGTDAGAYLYELSAGGDVIRRTANHLPSFVNRTGKVTRTNIHSQPIQNAAQLEAAQMHMDALAVSIAEKVYQEQLEEVTP